MNARGLRSSTHRPTSQLDGPSHSSRSLLGRARRRRASPLEVRARFNRSTQAAGRRGIDPGRWYRVTYRASRSVVAGVGLAAFRDAASAFRYRSDLPFRGRATYLFGVSQTGRFARQFLYDGFNADENGRRVFDAVWAHIAGAARGSFNERFAAPSHGDPFEATQFPFTDTVEADTDGSRDGLLRDTPRSSCRRSSTPIRRSSIGRVGGPRR